MKLARLREVRELRGWSQSKLAEESGVSRDGISNYETGHREAWPATAKKVADALGVEISDLVARAEEPVLAAGKAEAPREAGQAQVTAGAEENAAWAFRRVIELVMEAARKDAVRTEQAMNRVDASGGQPQSMFLNDLMDAGRRIEGEYDPADVVEALRELALEHAHLERADARLKQENARLRADLREREQALKESEQAYQELAEARNS